jgi:hypothetical protein
LIRRLIAQHTNKGHASFLAWFLFLEPPSSLMTSSSPNALSVLRGILLRRWIALAFLLGIAAAYASPVIQPRSIELLCSTNGAIKLISQTDDGQEASADVMHCGLCVPIAAPPPAISQTSFHSTLAYALQRIPASALAALTRPPLPARGPPAFS